MNCELYLIFAQDAATIGQHMFFYYYVVVPGIEMIVGHIGFAPLSLVLQKQNDNWYCRVSISFMKKRLKAYS